MGWLPSWTLGNLGPLDVDTLPVYMCDCLSVMTSQLAAQTQSAGRSLASSQVTGCSATPSCCTSVPPASSCRAPRPSPAIVTVAGGAPPLRRVKVSKRNRRDDAGWHANNGQSHVSLCLLLQILTSARSKVPPARRTSNAPTCRDPSSAQVRSVQIYSVSHEGVVFYHTWCVSVSHPTTPEAASLSPASIVSAVILVLGGVAAMLLLMFCYRRSVSILLFSK